MSLVESIFGVGVTTLDVIKTGGLGLGFIGAFLLVWFVSKAKAKSQIVVDLSVATKDLIDVLTENVLQSKILAESNEQRAVAAEQQKLRIEEVAKKAVETAESLASKAVETAAKLNKELSDYRDMQIERDRVNDEHQATQTEMLEDAAKSRQETIDKLVELEVEIAELKKLVETTGCVKLNCPEREAPQIPIKTRKKAAEKKEA